MPLPRPPAAKILTPAALAVRLSAARRRGRKIVFANGCFDLLHPGHIDLLNQARRAGDLLVVGVNADRSVRALAKGPGRPLVGERDRALVLAALECVDYVTIFSEPTPLALIARLRPDVLVKGADWAAERIIGRDLVRRVLRVRLKPGYSTTRLITRIAQIGDSH